MPIRWRSSTDTSWADRRSCSKGLQNSTLKSCSNRADLDCVAGAPAASDGCQRDRAWFPGLRTFRSFATLINSGMKAPRHMAASTSEGQCTPRTRREIATRPVHSMANDIAGFAARGQIRATHNAAAAATVAVLRVCPLGKLEPQYHCARCRSTPGCRRLPPSFEQCPGMAGNLLVLLRCEHKHLAARCAVADGIARRVVA